MNLKRELRRSNFDLLESPIRNHKPLQLWQKKLHDRIEFLHENINKAFSSDVELHIQEDNALAVKYNQEQEFEFNIGIKVLEELLKALELGDLGLSANLKKGKKVVLSYNNSITKFVELGDLSNFFSSAKFIYSNPEFIKNANRDNLIVISGVLMAKDIKATIETDFNINAELKAEFIKVLEGKIDFNFDSDRRLELMSEGNNLFPIAVQAHRIDWDRKTYKKLKLLTDRRFPFN